MSKDFDPFADLTDTPSPAEPSVPAGEFDPFADDAPLPTRAALRAQRAEAAERAAGMREYETASSEQTNQSGPARILVVCTGNVCRSPYIHLRLAQALAGTSALVESAGTGALVGSSVDPGSARLLEEQGVPHETFQARAITPQMIAAADLVLTATREHRREVVQLAPSALQRTFTLREFADLVRPFDASGSSLPQLLAFARDQRVTNPAGGRDEADIVDPFRQDESVFRDMAQQIDPSLEIAARALRRVLG